MFGLMTVEVGYELKAPPNEGLFDSLRQAARRLTVDNKNIQVSQGRRGNHHLAMVTFSMRQAAQYKVVGDISHQFRMDVECFHSCLGCWIAFPKRGHR